MTLLIRTSFVFLALTLVTPVAALQSDRQQQVDVAADGFEHDDRAGVSTLTGNVVLIQGTLRVDADRAVLYREGGILVRVEMFGAPALLEQELDDDQGKFNARADYMDYLLTSQLLSLRKNVVVDQGARRLSGDEIDYDLARGQVTGSGQSRVRMSFPPPESDN